MHHDAKKCRTAWVPVYFAATIGLPFSSRFQPAAAILERHSTPAAICTGHRMRFTMLPAKTKLPRSWLPKRTLTKKQAIRHLIHAAVRMIAAGSPFAIHLLTHSADKLLIDLAKKAWAEAGLQWGAFVKPEYKNAIIDAIRETYNSRSTPIRTTIRRCMSPKLPPE